MSYWDPCTHSYRNKRTDEPIPEADIRTANDEKKTGTEPIYEIEHWNPILCINKEKKKDEPTYEKQRFETNTTNKCEANKDKMRRNIRDEDSNAGQP